MDSIDKPFNLATMLAINAEGDYIAPSANRARFLFYGNNDGLRRIARYQETLKALGWPSFLVRGNEFAYQQFDGHATRIDLHTGEESLPTGAASYATVHDLLEAEAHPQIGVAAMRFFRLPKGNGDGIFYGDVRETVNSWTNPSTADDNESTYDLQPMLDIWAHFLAPAEHIADMDEDQAINVTAQVYLDCEFLHPKNNGNFRIHGLMMVSLLLAKAGLPFALIDNPNVSDGSSHEEVVRMIRDGMEVARGWMKLRPAS